MKYHEPKIITEDLYDAELGGISLFNTASPKGAEASAIIYSLAATATANGIPAEQYFTDLLRHPQNPPLPWN